MEADNEHIKIDWVSSIWPVIGDFAYWEIVMPPYCLYCICYFFQKCVHVCFDNGKQDTKYLKKMGPKGIDLYPGSF